APAGSRRRGCRGYKEIGPGEVPLPQPGAHPADPRPVDRQVHRAPGVGARRPQEAARGALMTSTQSRVVQVHRVYIRASAQAIWDAITQPEWTARYGYTGYVEYDLRPGGAYRVRPTEEFRAGAEARGNHLPEVIIEGEVLEADPPPKLVTTFRMLMDEQRAAA